MLISAPGAPASTTLELGHQLADYVSDLGFTVQLMPVMAHPGSRSAAWARRNP